MDYILFNTDNKKAVIQSLLKFFRDPNTKHKDSIVRIRENEAENQIIVEFKQIPNALFVFFFMHLKKSPELAEKYVAWFSISDGINFSHELQYFDDLKEGDTFSRRVFLPADEGKGFVTGYSEKQEKIDFYANGDYKVNSGYKFMEKPGLLNYFTPGSDLKIPAYNLNQTKRVMLIIGLAVALFFLGLGIFMFMLFQEGNM